MCRNPRIRVYVHSRGAGHLADPTKLMDSASRYFGAERMERYWSEIAPVPADRMWSWTVVSEFKVRGANST